jgi:hypothetical protein
VRSGVSQASGGFTLDNRSGYDTSDLRSFFRKGLRATGVRTLKAIVVVSSPIRTRGCAEVSPDRPGATIVIAIAPPGKFTLAKFARIFEHECTHAKGSDHEQMPESILWSEGDVPAWARGTVLRHRRRAPPQLGFLRG